MTGLRVAVVGAGIGGLTAALALRANGIDATVYEQAHELKALGAGVSIATNGSRILTTLGVGDAVAAIAGPVTHYQFRTWQAEPIAGEPSTLGFGEPGAHLVPAPRRVPEGTGRGAARRGPATRPLLRRSHRAWRRGTRRIRRRHNR
ncbi:NAD(P)-binding protein [Mycolicibacterium senegalense]|uniref:NAD(P)-binding protein n=1 Tax=Mycolicibacterium senegalense TaxID=1796 RepID=UPI003AAAF529